MATKLRHEVRDGLYGFIEFDNLEKQLIDSAPVQRLRSIHQLAMCYQVYPGATHKRFEHSLGVMEVASRIFRMVFGRHLESGVRDRIAAELQTEKRGYWERVVRVAALLHDVGHLPFSHAAEADLLPADWNHERLTAEMIRHSEIADILRAERPQIDPEDVVDVACDLKKRLQYEPQRTLDPWKTLLNEIITGDTFGADRIDYLLRDSLHAGVVYGRFDPHRLIDGLRAVIDPGNEAVALGLDIGAIHAAEALLLARYFMYTQVYFHDVRRIYDIHLKDFLKAYLPDGCFRADWKRLLKITDNEVLAALRIASANARHQHFALAERIMNRRHFRTVYTLVSTHETKRPTLFDDLCQFAMDEFGAQNVRVDRYAAKSERNDFLVLTDDQSVVSSMQESGVISSLPSPAFGFIFADPRIKEKAEKELAAMAKKLLSMKSPQRQRKGKADGS